VASQCANTFCPSQILNRIIIIELGLVRSGCELIGTPRMYEISSNSQTGSTAQFPQTGPSLDLNLQLSSSNPLLNESMTISDMMNSLNLEKPKSNNLNMNQNFKFFTSEGTNVNTFTYTQQAQQLSFHQNPSFYKNQGPLAKNELPAMIIPISNLNPYQGRWSIKARVASKGELRTYINSKGEGKVFSFDLIDLEQGEIRVTCFNNVAEQIYPKIDLDKVYMITKGALKQANKRFNPLNHEYELSLDSGSIIQPCEDDNTIPGVNFKFCQISDIASMANNNILDVIGVVTFISPATVVRKKNGTETVKCNLQLKDLSGCSVELTLWGSFVNSEGKQLQSMCELGQSPILAIKSCMVNEFNGKSVSSMPSSQLFVEPDCSEAQKLRDWFNRDGKSSAATPISFQSGAFVGRADNRKTIRYIEDEGLGRGDKPDWVIVKGMVTYMTENCCYTACPAKIGGRQCNKKVTSDGDGTWRCDMCDQNFSECNYR
jgi:replication factor A1